MDISIRRLLAQSFLWGVVLLNSSILNAYVAPPNPSTLNYPASSNTGTYTVSWTKVSSNAWYELQESKNNGTWYQVAGGEVGINSAVLSGRTNGSYLYRVRSCDDEGGCRQTGWKTGATALAVSLIVPGVSISASPETIAYNDSSTVSWSSSYATSCELDGVAVALSGSHGVSGLTSTRTFTLRCSNAGYSPVAQATVTVIPPPTFNSIVATPSLIGNGQSSVLTWSVSHATSCNVDGVAAGSPYTTPILSASRTFRVACSGISGAVHQDVLVSVQPPPVIDSYTVVANPLETGQSTTLNWSSRYANGCSVNGIAVAPSGSYPTGAMGTNQRFTLVCSGLSGNASRAIDLVVAPRTVINSFTLDSNPIAAGQSTTVRWSVTNASSCTLDGANIGVSGSIDTGAIQANRVFSLRCNGVINSPNQNLSLTVQPAPVIGSFAADSNPILSGTSTTLRWTSSNTNQCQIDGVSVALSGDTNSGNLTSSRNFRLLCSGVNASSAEKFHAVNVVGAPSATLSVANAFVEAGTSTMVSWTSTNTASCTLNGTPVALNSSQSTSTLTASKEYRLNCTSPVGAVERIATVTVLASNTVWRDVGLCDPNTGKLTQLCVEERVCAVGTTRESSGNCQLNIDCQQ